MSGQRRRGPADIRYGILRAAAGGQKKKRIMYQSSLNLNMLNKYLEELVFAELIGYSPTERHYVTTDAGIAFAEMFESYTGTADLLGEKERALERFLTSRAKKTVVAAS